MKKVIFIIILGLVGIITFSQGSEKIKNLTS